MRKKQKKIKLVYTYEDTGHICVTMSKSLEVLLYLSFWKLMNLTPRQVSISGTQTRYGVSIAEPLDDMVY